MTENPEPRTRDPEQGDARIAARAEELGRRLRALGLTLATAESCTGGGIADAITDVAGSSDYFLGGVVAYANRVKEQLLGVGADLLATQGAVSEPVALQMAEGVRRLLGADLGVGITGIAGPGGGSAEKPVGLVYIAVAGPEGQEVRRYLRSCDRVGNKRRSVRAALELLLEQLGR
ncbi:MAG: CinA family protein [Chloroflexota bacterium]